MKLLIASLLIAISYAQTDHETDVAGANDCKALKTSWHPKLTKDDTVRCINYASSGSAGAAVKSGLLVWQSSEKRAVLVKESGNMWIFTGSCTREHDQSLWLVECPMKEVVASFLFRRSMEVYFNVDLTPAAGSYLGPTQAQLDSLKSCTDRSAAIEVYYIRHGESVANEKCESFFNYFSCKACMNAPKAKLTGFWEEIYDAKLTPKGKKQAENLRAPLKKLLTDNNLDDFLIVASPNRRAFGTLASGLKEFLQDNPTKISNLIKIHPGLREIGNWCDVQSRVFLNMREANPSRMTGSPQTEDIKPAVDYLVKDLGFAQSVADELLEWDTFFDKKKAPWDMWLKTETKKKQPLVFKSLIDEAIRLGKKKILIGAHSKIMTDGFANYAEKGHLYCGGADTSLMASNARWKQLKGKKMHNGACVKFEMRVAANDEVQMRIDPEFQFKEDKDPKQRCFIKSTCATLDLDSMKPTSTQTTPSSSDVSVAQQSPARVVPEFNEHTALATSVGAPKSDHQPIWFLLFAFALGVFFTKIFEFAFATKANYHPLLEHEI